MARRLRSSTTHELKAVHGILNNAHSAWILHRTIRVHLIMYVTLQQLQAQKLCICSQRCTAIITSIVIIINTTCTNCLYYAVTFEVLRTETLETRDELKVKLHTRARFFSASFHFIQRSVKLNKFVKHIKTRYPIVCRLVAELWIPLWTLRELSKNGTNV